MRRKQTVIRDASKNLLSCDLTNWVMVEEILRGVLNAGIAIGKQSVKAYRSKPVAQYTKGNMFIERFNSATDAGFAVGCTRNAITQNARGETKTCGGFIFRYVEK